MNVLVYDLKREHDPSGVSGVGDAVATICEFDSGLVAMHWNSATPSVAVYTDVRHIESLHGHKGASTLMPHETRLEASYRLVMPYLLTAKPHSLPLQVAPHPDHPDRLRLVVSNYPTWRWWIALLDGSSDAASHEEVAGEMRHTWITPDGNVWLVWYSPLPDEHPLATFDREDR